MRILLVEDDVKLASLIRDGLEQAKHTVSHFTSGLTGFEQARHGSFDAAIFDLMLPDLDGISAIEKLRRENKSLPVLVLSAMNKVEDRVKGLQAGGDDYLTKPFALMELLARLDALTRRASGNSSPSTISVAGLAIDSIGRTVSFGGKTIELQPREFDLFRYLIRNAGTVVSKSMIIEEVWKYNFIPRTNVVEAAVCRLRDKIEQLSKKRLIHTIRGLGYEFKETP